MRAAKAELAAERRRAAAPTTGHETFRMLANTWLEHIADAGDAKPATLRDYRSMLAEPGTPYRRGTGGTIGRIMAALGDRPPAEITTGNIEKLLAKHAKENVGARSVNKHRQVISAIFNFGLRGENAQRWNLTTNPAEAVAKRKEPPPGRLEVFTIDQVETLARVAQSGACATRDSRRPRTRPARAAVACHRIHRAPPRRAPHPPLARRRMDRAGAVVERGLSANVKGTTKGRKVRYVPLGDQALGALDRLSRRPNFTGPNDCVFGNAAGDRIDGSALRRRYIAARDHAALPKLRFHDLRHTAGTLLTRVLDPVTVRDVLGHADLKTTERYLHAVRASRLADAAPRAFTPEASHDRGEAARVALQTPVAQLGPDEARRILEAVG